LLAEERAVQVAASPEQQTQDAAGQASGKAKMIFKRYGPNPEFIFADTRIKRRRELRQDMVNTLNFTTNSKKGAGRGSRHLEPVLYGDAVPTLGAVLVGPLEKRFSARYGLATAFCAVCCTCQQCATTARFRSLKKRSRTPFF
jgi:hypothetical protein